MADDSKPVRRGPGRPFPPGVSGNPGGRSKEFAAVQRQLREAELPFVPQVIERLRKIALEAEPKSATPAAKEYLDRVVGKAPQAIELTGKDGGPLEGVAPRLDLSKLSTEELQRWRELMRKAGGSPGGSDAH